MFNKIMMILLYAALAFSKPIAAETTALHTDWMDRSVKPQEDFFHYANGSWQQKNPIPAAYASWGSFAVLQEGMRKKLRGLMQEACHNIRVKPGSIEQKVGDFYCSGMQKRQAEGIQPLAKELQAIQAISNRKELQAHIARLQRIGVNAVFSFGSMQDFMDSTKVIGVLSQAGLGLPDRDYYLKKDKKLADIRMAYQTHIKRIFLLLQESPKKAAEDAAIVMKLETMLARASLSQIAQRDPHAVYHLFSLAELQKSTPYFSWKAYFTAMGLPSLARVNVAMPHFFKEATIQLQKRPIEEWKTYLRWQLIHAFDAYLSQEFVQERFRMTQVLTGVKTLLPRWQRVVHAENRFLGFALGQLYVEKYFPKEEKQEVEKMVTTIRKAFAKVLASRDWMSATTKKAALQKLYAMQARVGYPEVWWDYSSLRIEKEDYIGNIARATTFLLQRDLNKIGKPLDRSDWAMPPQTINAYYDSSMNNLNIPAGILQPPFFDKNAPLAINYGGIGFIIGHEMTHGFDDEGAQFDEKGNLKNWWAPKDLARFRKATQCIVEQFSQYKVNGDIFVQGKLVVGEAVADLGGLLLAYDAYIHTPAFSKAKTIENYTPQQQFFLSAAHIWAGQVRPEQERNHVLTDPHPPIQYRVNGTLANMPAFQEAFSIRARSNRVNRKPCVIW